MHLSPGHTDVHVCHVVSLSQALCPGSTVTAGGVESAAGIELAAAVDGTFVVLDGSLKVVCISSNEIEGDVTSEMECIFLHAKQPYRDFPFKVRRVMIQIK